MSRMGHFVTRAAAIAMLGLVATVFTGADAFAARFETSACAPDLAGAGARCGHVRVPENYAAPAGRSIALNVVVLPATTRGGPHEAQFELEGGPGIGVAATAGFYVTDGAIYRARRDIVFVDMRGTGGSNPLRCPAIEQAQASGPWSPLYPVELVAQCYDALSARADLNQYNTANAVRDLEAVRAALGYRRVVLNALSYGTTLALAYITEHPDRVRAAVLTGTVPADRTPPRFHAAAASKALLDLLKACAADAPCHAAFPQIGPDLAQARFMADDHAEMFMERLRTKMYAPTSARAAPLAIHNASLGDFSAFEKTAEPGPAIADGLYLSVTCAESFPHFPIDLARYASRATPFGDYRLRRQSAACIAWPVAPSDPPSLEQLDTPILFVAGEFDPVSPPEWVDGLLQKFPRGRRIILPGGGHVVEGMSDLDTCLDPLIVKFLDTGEAQNLDAACVTRMHAPAFVLQ